MATRVLSLDGGGPWALIQALALAEVYPGRTGHQVLAEFDYAIGTSGGSITLAGLAKGLAPADIAQLYQTEANRRRIFVARPGGGGVPAWKADAKLGGLSAIIDDGLAVPLAGVSLAEVKSRIAAAVGRAPGLIITGFDIDRRRATLFRSDATKFQDEVTPFTPSLAGAVHASTNAPVVFFDGPALVANLARPGESRRFWDGAIGGNNNPVLVGVMEALAAGATDIVALSLGTGNTWLPEGPALNGEPDVLFRQPAGDGLLAGVAGLATAILANPPDAASLNAHLVTRRKDTDQRVIRLNPQLSPLCGVAGGKPKWEVPSAFGTMRQGWPALDTFKSLLGMPMDAVDQWQIEVITAFAEAWLRDDLANQAILPDPLTGRELIGQGTFTSARDSWLALAPPRIKPASS